ncbi:hypothetical protein NL676_004857 [Syzygium grande]|nr:hypothetical protein NL676_004857 [Syzygium grande]
MESFEIETKDALIVERSAPVAVLPEHETPGGSLFLSNLDQADFLLPSVYSFDRSGANVVDVIKQALSKVLVHYYPLAGRLARNSEGKLEVDCQKKLGVPFVEASANCDIVNLGDKRLLDSNVLQKLVYRDFPEDVREVAPLLTAQVTRFRCGGFTLGIAINHCMVDASSGMNFMNSWAEIARGRPLSLIPCHDRIIMKSRVPPQITDASDNFVHVNDVSNLTALYKEEQIVWKSFHFDGEKLATLKNMATTDGQGIGSCSSFVALGALVWRARSKALDLKPHQLSKLLVLVDIRSKLKPPIATYFGNALVQACCLGTAGELINEPFSSTTWRIKKAIEKVNEDYVRSYIDCLDVYQPDLFSLSSLCLVSWQRLDYGSTDFGWGKPRNFCTGDVPTGCLFMRDESERKGIVVVIGLPLSAMNTFEKLVQLE